MSFRDDMKEYINQETGLVGVTPNKANFSTGNPLLDTGTAYVIAKELDEAHDDGGYEFINAVDSCSGSFPYLSKLPGTSSSISHDDIIGVLAGARASGYGNPSHLIYPVFCRYGLIKSRVWVLSTTGKFYWDALVKPWHKAFYLTTCGFTPWFGGRLMLSIYILTDALFNKRNTSDKKLVWLIVKTIKGRSSIVDFSINIWENRLKSVFSGIRNVFAIYYGNDHLFTKWGGRLG